MRRPVRIRWVGAPHPIFWLGLVTSAAGSSKTANSAIRSIVPSPSTSTVAGAPTIRPGRRSSSAERGVPGSPGSAEYVQSSAPSLPDRAKKEGVPRMAQTRSPVPSPSRSGVGWTSSPGRFSSPKWDSRRIAATGSRSGLHGRAGRAASQIGLPVDPSRRIKVSPFHSMKSALPGLNVTVSVTDENGMDSAPSKRFSSSVRW